ncbi:protein of unknown function DUF445 [Ruminiclostridium papyrosolvens DSM 2782]|uniref:DUF445 domain-containing protein n=1 Tax=Ruminiclostridium papyrosolvens DSM 2782 TaxID=588581 RepID=F1TI02_9FIRM|nr:DUF445 domain-containing protein [Ruminiclostridium papyrosolvens]EGD45937.1 protein of unknown function DUF445 [Ruminiclostridium papyrosolvens DSM 2782]WES33673.1 DUF445 domain-containing protein [Ruminiclostridium papyrosolvens DSM 2782]
MEKYSYTDENEKLRKKLRTMKIIATSLLVFMTLVFIIFRRLEGRGLLYSSIAAFAEASMVGALADWFAVVALFKHPLGLRIIPHTAIIAENKSRIAKALSNFVVSNFFTPDIIKSKLDKVSISKTVSAYVAKNREMIVKAIAVRLPYLADSFINDEKVGNYIKVQLNTKAKDICLYPLLGKSLTPLVESGYHKPIVKGILNATYKFISENKEKTILVLGGINKTLTMPFIGDLVYRKILEFLNRQTEEIDTNEEAEINKLIMSVIPKLINDMKNSQELIEKGETLKGQILDSEVYNKAVNMLTEVIVDYKNSYFENEEKLNEKVSLLIDMIISGINNNDILRETIDNSVIGGIESIVSQYGDRVGSLIYDTMEGWETKDMVDKLEVQVGADLQYIRINGTVIGGLAGLVIHLLTQLF